MENDTQITSKLSQDLNWARHHYLSLVGAAILVLISVYGIESILARRAHDSFEQAQAILLQMQKQNEQTQAASKAEIDALNQQNSVLQQQFATLSAAIASRDAQLFKDRQEVKSLPPSALATKWGAAANEPAPSIATNGDFDVPLPLAQKSYDALLQVPVLTKDNTDLKSEAANQTQLAANNERKFEDEQKAHTSDNATCKQTIATKDAEIKDVKAQARKRNIIVAIIGIALGYGLHR